MLMNNNSDLPNEIQQAIIARMMTEWQQMAYSAEVNVRVAERIDDDTMKQRSVDQVVRAEKALDVLREELEKLGTKAGIVSVAE